MLRKIEAEALEEDIIQRNDEKSDQKDEEFNSTDEDKSEVEICNMKEIECHKNTKSVDKYSCETCVLTFSNKMKYHKHLKIHDVTKQLRCDQCPQVFLKTLHLKVHLRSHIKKEDRAFVCSVCGEHFIFEYLLKQHSYKHTDLKPYPCKKCGKGKSKI